MILTGCEEGLQGLNFGKGKTGDTKTAKATTGVGNKIKLVERDVEAPEVFEKTKKRFRTVDHLLVAYGLHTQTANSPNV